MQEDNRIYGQIRFIAPLANVDGFLFIFIRISPTIPKIQSNGFRSRQLFLLNLITAIYIFFLPHSVSYFSRGKSIFRYSMEKTTIKKKQKKDIQ